MSSPAAPAVVRRRPFRRWVLLNLLLLGLVGLLAFTYPVEELSRRAGDLYFRLRGPQPPSNQVVLVLIDDASLSRYGRWPWRRALLARLIRVTSSRHPRAIGVDILLSESEDENDDRELAAAFRQAGNVVLAAKIGSAPEGQTTWVEPLPIFAESSAGIGHVQAVVGPDGICRSIPASEMSVDGLRPAFAIEVARVARLNTASGEQPAVALPGEQAFGAEKLSPRFLIVPFRGQILPGQARQPFPSVSAAELLEGASQLDLEGRVVLIGFGSTEITDRLPTPVSDQLPMPGVEIHANLVDALLAGRDLEPVAPGVQILALVGASLLLTGLLLRRPGWLGLLASALLTVAVYGIGYLLFVYYQRIMAFGPFLCLGILAAPLTQLENLIEVDRGLTRSLRQLENALRPTAYSIGAGLRTAVRSEVSTAERDLHWKVATVNRLEAELGSLYAFDQTLLDSMQEGLAVFGSSGSPIFRNPYWEDFCRKLELEPAATLEEVVTRLGQAGWRDLPEKLAGQSTRLEAELLHGRWLWQLRAVRLPSTSHAGTRALMVVVTDLTARLERDRSRAEALGFVTHELRTPLVSIQGFAEFLLRYPQAPGSSEAAETIFRESKRLVAMINTYLDVLRMESGARPLREEPVNIEETVNQVERVMRPLAQAAEVVVHVDSGTALPSLRGDPQLIAGALLNLVSNAVKYSPRKSEVCLRVLAEAENVVFEVINPGPVISPEELARLFQPFYRSQEQERTVPGWGLGLAFVKRITEAHGGHIEATSDATTGTRFRIVFPGAPAEVCETTR